MTRKNVSTVSTIVQALMIMILLMLAPQLSGVSAILAYTSFIFKASGSKLSSSVSVIIVGLIQFLSGALSVFTVDLLGRRPLMIFSVSGSALFLIGRSPFLSIINQTKHKPKQFITSFTSQQRRCISSSKQTERT